MQKLRWDLDGVVLNFNDPFLEFYNKHNGTSFSIKDVKTYDYEDTLGISSQEVGQWFERFYASDDFWNVRPYPGAVEALAAIDGFYDQAVITSRPAYVADRTCEQVTRFFGELLTNITHTTRSNPKAAICRNEGADFLVEDCLKYANECAPCCKQSVFMVKRSYNQNQKEPMAKGLVVVKDAKEVADILLFP